MNAILSRQERFGWPSQARPDRKLPEPWTAELLLSINTIHHHTLSPDGSKIAFIWMREGNSDLWVLSSDGQGWPQRLTFDRPARTPWSDSQPRFSPDGSLLLYSAREDIWVVPAQGGKAKRITDFKHGDSNPIFSPDGERIYFLSGRKEFHNLCWTNRESGWPIQLTIFEGDVSDPQPSPDGTQIAFVYYPQIDLNRSEICLVSSTGGAVKHLTGAAGVFDYRPRWSPDGKQIAFLSTRSGWRELFLLDATTGEISPLTSIQADIEVYSWSRDRTQIVLVINRQGAADLHLLDIPNRTLRLLRADNGCYSAPQWSPDGSWLTVEFESPSRPPDIYRIDIPSGVSTQLTFSMPPAFANARLIEPEYVIYPGLEGVSVPAMLYRPHEASAGKPCPAVVYPHGGPTDEHTRSWDILTQWLVAKGYAVLAPNYRGSTGHGMEYQRALHGNWGIVDTQDVLAGADYLANLDWVDGNRLGIYGASYGSYLALLALARDPQHRFKCGVAKYGDCDIRTSWAQGDRPGRVDLERQMKHPAENRQGYFAGSPVYDVANIQAPLLIMHGEKDERVHPQQSEQLAEALNLHKKTFEYFLYADEGHGFLKPATQTHFYETLERFLDWYLM